MNAAKANPRERTIRPSDDPKLLISIPEAQQVVPLCESMYRLMLTRGKLHRYKVGSRTFLKLGEVLQLARKA